LSVPDWFSGSASTRSTISMYSSHFSSTRHFSGRTMLLKNSSMSMSFIVPPAAAR
jgi:hypothetical protein